MRTGLQTGVLVSSCRAVRAGVGGGGRVEGKGG